MAFDTEKNTFVLLSPQEINATFTGKIAKNYHIFKIEHNGIIEKSCCGKFYVPKTDVDTCHAPPAKPGA